MHALGSVIELSHFSLWLMFEWCGLYQSINKSEKGPNYNSNQDREVKRVCQSQTEGTSPSRDMPKPENNKRHQPPSHNSNCLTRLNGTYKTQKEASMLTRVVSIIVSTMSHTSHPYSLLMARDWLYCACLYMAKIQRLVGVCFSGMWQIASGEWRITASAGNGDKGDVL